MKKVFSRIAELRNGVSLREMQRLTGIPATTIDRAEKGDSDPKTELLIAYHDAFGVSVDWLLGLSDTKLASASASQIVNSQNVSHGDMAIGGAEALSAEVARLWRIVESQQRVIESLAGGAR